jgi:hypothetical protein
MHFEGFGYKKYSKAIKNVMFSLKPIYTSDIALPASTNFACLRPRLQFCTSMRLWEQGLTHRGQN